MNTSSVLIGIGIAVLLAGGAWWYTQRGSTEPLGTVSNGSSSPSSGSCLPASQLPRTLTVEYRDSGFFAAGGEESSATFCVPKGGTVTFTGGNFWVASDPHPIHTDVPGFDAKGAKETFSFTFDQAGTVGFHNHLRASDTGTIIVVE